MIHAILLLVASAGPLENNPIGAWHSPAEAARAGGVYSWSGDMGCVYIARNKVNGKGYVGKTSRTMKYRIGVHKACAVRDSHTYFHNALRKYGFDAFDWKVLFSDVDEDDLNPVEITAIRLLGTRTLNGYNLTDGGDGIVGYRRIDGTY